jgi:hypothetical protein
MIDISPAERRLNIQLDATWSSMQHLILPQSPLLPIMQSADTVLSKLMDSVPNCRQVGVCRIQILCVQISSVSVLSNCEFQKLQFSAVTWKSNNHFFQPLNWTEFITQLKIWIILSLSTAKIAITIGDVREPESSYIICNY